MGQLILYNAEGHQIGARPMDAAERIFYYQCWFDGDLIPHGDQLYRLITVAWCIPQEDLRCLVVSAGPVPVVYEDD